MMNKEINKIREYYDNDDEENRFSDPRKRIEYIITCRIIDSYIRKNSSVLDCAAGTGAYEDFLLNHSCKRVVASDLSPRNVELLYGKYLGNSSVEVYLDNALDLSRHKNDSFDLVLCLGPMYHLRPNLGQQCLLECFRVLKPEGFAIVAYMPRHFAMWNLLYNSVYKIPFCDVMFLARNGYLPNTHKGFWGCSYFSFPSEMIKLVGNAGFSIVEHRAVDLEMGNFYDKLSLCTQEELDCLSDYLFDMSDDVNILGSSKHNLIILKKNTIK